MKKLILILVFLLAWHPAFAALTIDGSGVSTTFSNASSVTSSLTTADTDDIIVIYSIITTPITGNNCSIASISDGSSLTWTKRFSSNDSIALSQEEWSAKSSSSLSSDSIVVHYNATTCGGRVIITAVNGANLSTPFDTNGSLPSSSYGTTATALTQTISTTNPNTLILAGMRTFAAYGTLTRPSVPASYTQVVSSGTAQDLSYAVASSSQSGIGVTYSWTAVTTESSMFVDALQSAGSVTTTPDLLLNGDF